MSELVKQVEFVKSSPDAQSCPPGNYPEYAFVGRSNVGKSSLINYLAGQKKLAKTSGQPGRTQLINHFLVDKSWYLVDLPGYGYAKLSKKERGKLMPLIEDYLLKRTSLTCLFILIDSRHAPQTIDLDFIRWVGLQAIPFVLCFTKTDKLTYDQLQESVENYKATLLQEWESLPPNFLSSTLNQTGREEILKFITKTNQKLEGEK